MCLLTFPLTFLPPAEMIENSLIYFMAVMSPAPIKKKSVKRSASSSLLSVATSSTVNDYARMEPAGHSQHTHDGEYAEAIIVAETGASFTLRCCTRFVLITISTVVAVSIPCFGVVSAVNTGDVSVI